MVASEFDEASGQATQAAVTETRLDLLVAQRRQVDPAQRETLLGDVGQVGGQQRVAELAAQQVLRGQVADDLRLVLLRLAAGLQPPGHQVVAHGGGERQVLVVDAGTRQCHALIGVQLVKELADEAVDGKGRRPHRRGSEGVGRGLRRPEDTMVGRRGLVGRERGGVLHRIRHARQPSSAS
ncbi:hypothetical protein [Propioniciclava flava]